MFRKLIIATATVAALGAASLTTASAHGHGGGFYGHHHHFYGPRFVYGGPVYVAYNSCWRTRWVATPWGPRLRRVNVCAY